MIDTACLVPPGFGPTANPLLFGVAEGLSRLFPLPQTGPVPAGKAAAGAAEGPNAAREAAPASEA